MVLCLSYLYLLYKLFFFWFVDGLPSLNFLLYPIKLKRTPDVCVCLNFVFSVLTPGVGIFEEPRKQSQSYRLTINLWPLISFGGLKPINKCQMHKQMAFLLRTMIIPNLKHTFPSVSSDVLPERIAGHTDCNFLHCFGQMCHQRTGFRFGLSNFF